MTPGRGTTRRLLFPSSGRKGGSNNVIILKVLDNISDLNYSIKIGNISSQDIEKIQLDL